MSVVKSKGGILEVGRGSFRFNLALFSSFLSHRLFFLIQRSASLQDQKYVLLFELKNSENRKGIYSVGLHLKKEVMYEKCEVSFVSSCCGYEQRHVATIMPKTPSLGSTCLALHSSKKMLVVS